MADTPRSLSSSLWSEPGQQQQQDVKEKVLVCIRIRPLQDHEKAASERKCWHAHDESVLVHQPVESEARATEYVYNRVFAEECTSEQVYNDCTKQLVLSAMDGYNATIFAYGMLIPH